LTPYRFDIETAFGKLAVIMPDTEWGEAASVELQAYSESPKGEFHRFVREHGVGIAGVRFDSDFCAPEDLYAALVLSGGAYFDDWSLSYGYNPADEDEVILESSIDSAADDTDTEPTEGQKIAGNYKKGSIVIDGLTVKIENPAGSKRSGTDPSGKKWESKMHSHYGYISGTESKDGDEVDVFIRPGIMPEDAVRMPVFVIDQVDPKTGKFDEHKAVIGHRTAHKAKAAYLECYEKGWQGLGKTVRMEWRDFKKWVQDKTGTKKPADDSVFESTPQREDYAFGCLMASLSETTSQALSHFARSLPAGDIKEYCDTGEPWIEENHHITIKHGIQDGITVDRVENAMPGLPVMYGRLGRLAVFEHDSYDVLYIEVYSRDLTEANRAIANNLTSYETQDRYVPHITLAYLRPGAGRKYTGMDFFSGIELKLTEMVYTDPDGNAFTFSLQKG
jgi:hypothetical protein